MKVIPTVIDKCSDCSFAIQEGIGWRCRRMSNYFSNPIYTTFWVNNNDSIPDWCPLPESNINKLLSDIENLKGIIPLGHELNDQDIVCKYIRRNKIIANL